MNTEKIRDIELKKYEIELIIKLLNKEINKLNNKKNILNKKLKCQELCRVERINLDLYSNQLYKYNKILRKLNQFNST